MEVVVFELREIDDRSVELRYPVGKLQYESRTLGLAEVKDLYKFDRYFDRHSSHLKKIGRQLFDWLDGNERWLSRSIQQHRRGGLVIAIDAKAGLGGLPWEVLSDKKGFLVERSIIPIRVVDLELAEPMNPANHLRVLFMATDPMDVRSKLNFEQEEAAILAATRNLPMDLRVEESGNLEELKDLWARYGEEHKFQIFHLNGHADIDEDGEPFFITESLDGMRVDAKAEDFADVFESYYPPLIFLSGCRTGESTRRGATTSLAAALVARGAPAVIGWGRPVGDDGAIEAAKLLYKALVQGETLAKSLAATYKGLIKQKVPDWCLLRLYAQMGAWEALVSKQNDRIWLPPLEPETEFLDPQEGQVMVAGKDAFVGRRRYLQRCLKALTEQGRLGILLHGLAGVGKSSIACRLLDRLAPSYQRLVIRGMFDEGKVLNLLSRQCESSRGLEILEGDLRLNPKLSKFLKQGLNTPNQLFIFVLDDFEQNLEEQDNGDRVLKGDVLEALKALLDGIRNSNLPHRIIVTCRYRISLPQPYKNTFEPFQVEKMNAADVKKLINRLPSFDLAGGHREWQKQVLEIADGYPRLLNQLDKVLLDDRLDRKSILTALKTTRQEYLESTLAEKLLEQQEPELRLMLERCTIFELPVPLDVLKLICQDLADEFDRYVSRSKALGLLESGLTEALVRVPKVLDLATREDRQKLAAQAVKELDRKWDRSSTPPNEEQQIEIHRLAILGGDGVIAVKMTQRLLDRWIALSRYREALTLGEKTLALQKDGTIVYKLAEICRTLGELQKASHYASRSIDIHTEMGDRQGVADSLHQLLETYYDLCKFKQALQRSEESIDIYKEISDRRGIAASLHQQSRILRNLGKFRAALKCSEESIDIYREIGIREKTSGNRKGEADYLRQQSRIYRNLGEFKKALELSKESSSIYVEIGDRKGEADSLHQQSRIRGNLGEFEMALQRSEESSEIYTDIGNRKGEADSLHQQSRIYYSLGNLQAALERSQRSIEIQKSIDYRKGEAASLQVLSVVNYSLGNLDDARNKCNRSIEIYDQIGNLHGVADSKLQLSRICRNFGDLKAAHTLAEESLDIDKEIGYRQGESDSLHQLSRIYHNLGNLKLALKRAEQSIDIDLEIGYRQGQATSLHQLSRINQDLGKLKKALRLAEKSVKINKEISNRQGEAASLHQLSKIYKDLGNLNKALEFSNESKNIYTDIRNRKGEADSLHQMSIIYHSLGELNPALTLSQQSIEIRRDIGNRQDEAASLHQMSIIYYSLGELNLALTLSQQSIEIRRDIGNRQGEAASLAQMAFLAGKQGDLARERKLYLQAATIRGSIGDYGGLIITLSKFGINNDEPDALSYLAQSLWLTLRLSTNLKDAISLIRSIFDKIPTGDPLKALLGATALHFCATRYHPQLEQLAAASHEMLDFAARQQGIATPEEREQWLVTSPDYLLVATSELLESMVGDGWLFERSGLQG
jgi:tetratricopeptide (TPR) repeat protein